MSRFKIWKIECFVFHLLPNLKKDPIYVDINMECIYGKKKFRNSQILIHRPADGRSRKRERESDAIPNVVDVLFQFPGEGVPI